VCSTFSVDANSILQVKAEDKGTGKSHKITITNETGRLSASEIEKMVADAKRFEADDRAAQEKTAAKNQLEGYVYSLRNSVQDSKFSSKLSSADRTTLTSAVDAAIKWIDAHPNEPKPIYEAKQKELEAVANPLMAKAYGAGGGSGSEVPGASDEDSSSSSHSAGSSSSSSNKGPTVQEVD
jgi:heat shock protein 1/8